MSPPYDLAVCGDRKMLPFPAPVFYSPQRACASAAVAVSPDGPGCGPFQRFLYFVLQCRMFGSGT